MNFVSSLPIDNDAKAPLGRSDEHAGNPVELGDEADCSPNGHPRATGHLNEYMPHADEHVTVHAASNGHTNGVHMEVDDRVSVPSPEQHVMHGHAQEPTTGDVSASNGHGGGEIGVTATPDTSVIEPILKTMRTYLSTVKGAKSPEKGLELVRKAYTVAHEAHAGQKRQSGDLYIEHPLAVAKILLELKLDPCCIAGAFLHDVPEDTKVSLDDIRTQFGDEIAAIVDGVTKLTSIEGRSKEDAQIGTYRKMFVAMADDPRVVLIKLADRLHNVRTLDAVPAEKQRRVARETLELYAPLAHRLGIWQWKWELEDRAFRYFQPEQYADIKRQLNVRRDQREKMVGRVKGRLEHELRKEGIEGTISGRPKHIYSIARKMDRKGVPLDQIFDQLAVRVIVKTVSECYRVLGIVHTIWKPVAGEFDDYIAVPKESMYQSLHTTVFIPSGQPCEVQIRTHDMHEVAEHGIAAHWRYKEGTRPDEASFDAKLHSLRDLLNQDEGDARAFVEAVKAEVLEEQVYVFTPKSKIIDLAKGSTPIDFAYRIHTEVGNRCVGAKVNGKQVAFDYQLQNGDVVQIMTTKVERGPSRDWIDLVKTSNARNHIRRWFRRQNRDSNIATGRDLLERELKKLSLTTAYEDIARVSGHKDVEDLLYTIGIGEAHPRELLRKAINEGKEQQALLASDPLLHLPAYAPPPKDVATKFGIHVHGDSDIYTRLAGCCNPVVGEDVVGFVTRGKGLTIHRADCYNIVNEQDRERLMDVSWGSDKEEHQHYPVPIRIECWDRIGLWRDVTEPIANMGVSISSVQQLKNRHADRVTLIATVMVDSLKQLTDIIDKLNRVQQVIEARRDHVPTA